MSRIGKLPVLIPNGVQVILNGNEVEVRGPKGVLKRNFSSHMNLEMKDDKVLVNRNSDEKFARALHGTTRSVLQNMVTGVSQGFSKVLEIDGVGYRAEMDGANLMLYVGFSHSVKIEPPEGITFEVDTKTRRITISGNDKEKVGQHAADIRKIRPPEPYKGKGIYYLGERIRRKAGKSIKTTI